MRNDSVCLFGAGLDLLDDPERVSLKQAYIEAKANSRLPQDLPLDPYDALSPHLVNRFNGRLSLAGKLELAGWLTPRPGREWAELVRPEYYRASLDQGLCQKVAEACQEFITENILPAVPGLLVVDHSLAGAAIRTLAGKYGAEAITCIVLDSHFDGIPSRLRYPEDRAGFPLPDTYHCGSFLHYLMEEGSLIAENLILLGVSDHPGSPPHPDAHACAYLDCTKQGVTFFTKSQVKDERFTERFRARLNAIRTPFVYVSLDADVGACTCLPAVRFMDRVGLEKEEILSVAEMISGQIQSGQFRLAGFDISEIDVHLLGLDKDDTTIEVCLDFIERLIGGSNDYQAG